MLDSGVSGSLTALVTLPHVCEAWDLDLGLVGVP